jgi:hypothetical protein
VGYLSTTPFQVKNCFLKQSIQFTEIDTDVKVLGLKKNYGILKIHYNSRRLLIQQLVTMILE